MRKATKKKMWIATGAIVILFLIAWIVGIFYSPFYNKQVIFGTSFDPEYAGYLGFDPKVVWNKVTNDWGFEYIRLPVHWNKLESVHGRYDFAETDWYMRDAMEKKLKVVLAIGQKTPRWPECHIPAWAAKLAPSDYSQELNKYLKAVAARYKDNPALEMWQVENEPFLSFGVCPDFSVKEFGREIAMVKNMDVHNPVLVSDSGELSTWIFTARAGDYFGTTMYRVVWDKMFGYFSYDWLPAWFYRAKLALLGLKSADSTYVMELQAEPWVINGKSLDDITLAEQNLSMSVDRFNKNVEFAKKVGLPRVYLWGAEWWYWSENKGNSEIVQEMVKLKKN